MQHVIWIKNIYIIFFVHVPICSSYLLFCTIFEKVIGEFIRWFDQWKIHFMNINYDNSLLQNFFKHIKKIKKM